MGNAADDFRKFHINPMSPDAPAEMFISILIQRLPEDIKACNEKGFFSALANILNDRQTQAYLQAKTTSPLNDSIIAKRLFSKFSNPMQKFFDTPTYFKIDNTQMLVAEIIVRDFIKYADADIPLKEKKFKAKLIFRVCLEALLFSKKDEYKKILVKAAEIDPKGFKDELKLAIIVMNTHAWTYEQEGNIEGKEKNLAGVKVLKELYKSLFNENPE
jgi:hypothetical protein